jgi:hypothetical protein
MSGLIEELENRASGPEKGFMRFESLLEQMSEDERKSVIKSLDLIKNDTGMGKAKVYSCAWLADVLSKYGYSVSRTTIRRYINEHMGGAE